MIEDKVKAVLAELEAVCRKHNVILVGTCEHEGIYGEITIQERGLNTKEEWRDMWKRRQNLCAASGGGYQVGAIGNESIGQ